MSDDAPHPYRSESKQIRALDRRLSDTNNALRLIIRAIRLSSDLEADSLRLTHLVEAETLLAISERGQPRDAKDGG